MYMHIDTSDVYIYMHIYTWCISTYMACSHVVFAPTHLVSILIIFIHIDRGSLKSGTFVSTRVG